ncbi:MAG TPA: SurA N-terminal domain-containing protein [Anaeromyxobacter sp.]|nr:SurA N-terminal domain-containing protein [Anaeromyxobacter sp.]
MLDVLRSNAKSTFTWIIVAGIAVVFAINFGPGSLARRESTDPGEQTYAARVNGAVVPVSDWERQYVRLHSLVRAQMGEAFNRELVDALGLGRQAMEQVVDQQLVIQEAKRRGLAISKAELTRVVHEDPSFQENGQFRFEVYEDYARRSYGSPAKLEASLKDQLLFRKMMAAVRETVKLPASEIRAAWEADADRAALSFVRFPIAAAEAQVAKPTEAEVKAFAGASADRIAKAYEDERARWDQKRKVRVRHVLARVAPDGDEAAARKKIEDAKARVQKGEDFARVAAALSEDANTKDRGGEIGFVSEGLFDEAFASAALALEQGQLSDPVRSASGWHLVQAEEVVPAKQVPLEQATPQIARELLVKDRARKLADERARAALAAARGGRALADLFPPAGAKGKKPVQLGGQPVAADETGPFGRGTPFLPKLGDVAGLRADAFAAKKGDVLPGVYETPAGPVVAVVTLRETPDAAAFEAQRAAIETRLRNRKESQVQTAWLEAIRKTAKVETNPALVAATGSPE